MTEQATCGHPGSNDGRCGHLPGRREPHRPVHVITTQPRSLRPIRDAVDLVSFYPGMLRPQEPDT